MRLTAILKYTFLIGITGAIVAGVVYRDVVRAQWRATVLGADLYEIPILSRLTQALTDEPTVTDIVVGAVPSTVCQPAGSDEVPTVVFITGADANGKDNADLVRTCQALARAGVAMYIPDLPGLREGVVGRETVQGAAAYVVSVAGRPRVSQGKVGLASASTGASLAILIAAADSSRESVSMVAGIAPFADVRTVVQLATTSSYEDAAGDLKTFRPDEWLRVTIARSLITLLAESGVPQVITSGLQQQVNTAEDPFDPFRALPPQFIPANAEALIRVLANRDGRAFAKLWADLPADMIARADALSPISVADRVDVPVELIVAPTDKYFPTSESERLVAALPEGRLSISDGLNHASPDAGNISIGGAWTMNAFLVRSLVAAQ